MKDVPAELLYVLMFLAIVLFQYLMKRFGPQGPEEPAWDERPEQSPEAPEDTPAVTAAFGVAGSRIGDAEPDAPLAPPRRRFSRVSLMGSRREVQNAVVIAAIVGPCRAFESHDIRQ